MTREFRREIYFSMGLELIFDSIMHCALLISDSRMLEKSPAISVAIWRKKTAWNELLASQETHLRKLTV